MSKKTQGAFKGGLKFDNGEVAFSVIMRYDESEMKLKGQFLIEEKDYVRSITFNEDNCLDLYQELTEVINYKKEFEK